MRLCVVTANPRLAHLDKATLLARLTGGVGEHEVEDVYVVTPRQRGADLKGAELGLCGLWESPGRRMRLCRGLLSLVQTRRWLPSWLSALPLRLCREEILEAVRACDPDVVVLHDLRWSVHLRRLILRRYPHLTCLAPGERLSNTHPRRRRVAPPPRVSIVLPTYNGVKYLRQSIESCLRQTLETIELIVVDDGSTEDVRGIVETFDDPRLKYVRHDTNRGLPAALNTGFRHSTGAYLTWTSDDNYFADDAIEHMVAFLKAYPEVDFVYANCFVVAPDATLTIPKTLTLPRTLERYNNIGACFLYTRTVYEAIGAYDASCFLAEDYDYWLRIAKQFRMQRLFRPLYYYRRHPESLTDRYGGQAVAKQAAFVQQRNRA